MAFKKSVDFLQLERDEVPGRRPLLLYITAPIYSKDYTLRTSQHKHFKPDPSLPEGVLKKEKKEGSSFNVCLIEANPKMERFEAQISAAMEEHKEAAHKVVVVNSHGEEDGILLKHEEGSSGERVVLSGRHFGELITRHTHDNHLHVFLFVSYGHVFSNQLYSYVQKGCPDKLNKLIAITYFTSEASPRSWDKITTAGNGHVEVTRELGGFIKSNIEPNSAYKPIEGIRPQCVIL